LAQAFKKYTLVFLLTQTLAQVDTNIFFLR